MYWLQIISEYITWIAESIVMVDPCYHGNHTYEERLMSHSFVMTWIKCNDMDQKLSKSTLIQVAAGFADKLT